MDNIERDIIVDQVRQTMDINPDAGVLTTIKDACDLNDIEMSEQEMNQLAFDILFTSDNEEESLF